jgi:hypothetical protein
MNRLPIMSEIEGRLAAGHVERLHTLRAARQPRKTGSWGNSVRPGICSKIVIKGSVFLDDPDDVIDFIDSRRGRLRRPAMGKKKQ